MASHEDQTLLDELRRLGETAIEQAASGDFGDARESFAHAAWICQGADWLEKEASAAG